MWIMTTRGFYSAVEKWEDRDVGMVTIRARDKKDLENLRDLLPDATPFRAQGYSDYPWRIRVYRDEWADAVATLALEVDYTNFKDEVKAVQGERRAAIYGRVWAALLDIEPLEEWRRRNNFYAPKSKRGRKAKGKGRKAGTRTYASAKPRGERAADEPAVTGALTYTEAQAVLDAERLDRDFFCTKCFRPGLADGEVLEEGAECECGGTLFEIAPLDPVVPEGRPDWDDPFVVDDDPDQETLDRWLAGQPPAEAA